MSEASKQAPQAPAITQLQGIRRGIEKESLRALPNGMLALTPHPLQLGSALTHDKITTDFSESQLELITGVHASANACLAELQEIHQAVYQVLQTEGEERLWVSSMPCGLPTDETIPLGRYGSSNVGRSKSIYRMGLGQRYGRRMQTISGIHYNWSLPEVSTEQYFGLIRNFRRHSFLLLYLFGASPALCSTFVAGRQHELQALGSHTFHMPYGTSLRMGRLGYQSDAQSSLAVSYNCLERYAASLQEALTRPYPAYEAIGVRNPGGDYNQLSPTLLQIENEFYGTIRPKRVIRQGERPLHALRERGVEYVEVRCMDLDPFEPLGINAQTMRFLDVFLLHCLTQASAPDTPEEIAALGANQHRTAARGREPGLRLQRGGAEVDLREWGAEIVEQCAPLAAQLDTLQGGTEHAEALAMARARLADAALTPSARVLAAMKQDFGDSHVAFIRAQSEQTRQRLLALPWSEAQNDRYVRMTAESIAAQRRIEAADTVDFETYRQQYLAQQSLVV
ncbi:glutamate--cysteine ligase [Roseateles sp.]|jgi:glutamate--cysteine ligase|uniref:glutamate--cysteine ligase n=1 Tax=Roseateles sp. TaxID=1971397 RepID=UPI0039197B78